MKHPEFRAVTAGKHILFNLADCFDTMSELDVEDYNDLLDWIASGNNPDRFTGLCDSEGVPIYENDNIVTDVGTDKGRYRPLAGIKGLVKMEPHWPSFAGYSSMYCSGYRVIPHTTPLDSAPVEVEQ